MPNSGLLIIGAPRSGTTLLASMIGAHPETAITIEDLGHGARFISGASIWGNKLCVPNQIRLSPRPESRDLLTRVEDAIRAFVGQPRHRGLPREHDPAYYNPPPHRQTTIRTYVEEWDTRLIAILRSPNQSIDSMLRRGQVVVRDKDRSPEVIAKDRWARATRTIYRCLREYEDRTLVMSFSSLVKTPEAQMERVSKHLGIEMHPSMLQGFQHTPQYSERGIDPSKADRKTPDYDIGSHDPKSALMYDEIIKELKQPTFLKNQA